MIVTLHTAARLAFLSAVVFSGHDASGKLIAQEDMWVEQEDVEGKAIPVLGQATENCISKLHQDGN